MATKAKVDGIEKTAENTRVEPIRFSYKDNDSQYTLEFSRATVKFAERNGFPLTPFNADTIIQEKPFTILEDLFYYSFQMHHRGINKATTDKILYEDFGGMSEEVIARLTALYIQAYVSLINVDEGKAKNPNLIVEL